ncbi:MAG TPA: T9SS type A sorting domain-containing protein [Chitinophagaceae bacterium]|nr:T9SS type A sorting domain-containing protein [Chitinophagaceae bacterium]
MTSRKNTLLHYASMAACVLSAKTLAAQAVYTDLDPDVVVEMDPEILNIDMNGDGVLDFAFMNEIYTIFTFDSEPQSYRERIWAGPKNPNNAIAGSLNQFTLSYGGLSTYYYPFALPFNAPINEALEFQNAGYQRMASRNFTFNFPSLGWGTETGGNWYPEITNYYLGVRFVDTVGCNHYGWIRCDVSEEGRVLVVKDYAYETKCDIGIAAGDIIGDTTVIVGIENQFTDNINIWTTGFTINISAHNQELPLICTVVSMQGQKVFDARFEQATSEIQLNDVAAGIYIVSISNSNGMRVERKIKID